MIKKLSIAMFGLALLIVGACSQNNGNAVAQQNLSVAKEIGVVHGIKIRRFVDCDAKTFVYAFDKSITVISSHQLSTHGASYIYDLCRGN